MHRFLSILSAFLLMALLSPAGLAQTAKTKLVGTWTAKLEVDDAKLTKFFRDMGLNEAQVELALKTLKSTRGDAQFTLTFNADGTSTAAATGLGMDGKFGKSDDGKWEVSEEAGNKVKLKVTDGDGKVDTLNLEFSDDDSFTLTMKQLEDAPLKKPVFKRQKKAE